LEGSVNDCTAPRRIANAVSWLRANFDQQVNIEDMAKLVNMSVTSFHRQFRAVTGMSPLQYQKSLRLQEARHLMLAAMLDAGQASRRVGYSSASQFTREYGRFFGRAPTKTSIAFENRVSPRRILPHEGELRSRLLSKTCIQGRA